MNRAAIAVICIWAIAVLTPIDHAQGKQKADAQSIRGLAIEQLREKAAKGDADAQFALGGAYYGGIIVRRDFKEAARWLTLSAEHGDSRSQFYLAELYRTGKGVKRDAKEAVRLYELSAASGSTDAQYSLGLMYQQGHGVQRDLVAACKWLTMAAEKDHRPAQLMLSMLYMNGDQIGRDLVKAWILIADRSGRMVDPMPGIIRSQMRGEEIDKAERMAAVWVASRAQQDNPK